MPRLMSADIECLLENLREQIPRLANGNQADRSKMQLRMLVSINQFLLQWFPSEAPDSGAGTETSRKRR